MLHMLADMLLSVYYCEISLSPSSTVRSAFPSPGTKQHSMKQSIPKISMEGLKAWLQESLPLLQPSPASLAASYWALAPSNWRRTPSSCELFLQWALHAPPQAHDPAPRHLWRRRWGETAPPMKKFFSTGHLSQQLYYSQIWDWKYSLSPLMGQHFSLQVWYKHLRHHLLLSDLRNCSWPCHQLLQNHWWSHYENGQWNHVDLSRWHQ